MRDVTDKELISTAAINPMIEAEDLVNVNVQYVEVMKPTLNHATVDQNKISRVGAREVNKTQENRPTENTTKWMRIEPHKLCVARNLYMGADLKY